MLKNHKNALEDIIQKRSLNGSNNILVNSIFVKYNLIELIYK